MATEKINMPQLGESVTEGTISSWLISSGDHVNKYDPIAEVMTDKVNAEVPSLFTGVIQELSVQEGDTLQVGELMGYIETEDTSDEEAAVSSGQAEEKQGSSEESAGDQSMKKRYSPAVLKLAQEHNIDLEQVSGSGRSGRITRKDIEQLIASGKKPEQTATGKDTEASSSAQVQQPEQAAAQKRPTQSGDSTIPVTGVRKAIAQNMARSAQEIPHAWMAVEADVTELVRYRDQVKDNFKQNEGFNLTYFAFFVKAVAQALKEYPQLNSSWADDQIIQHRDINLSIAVAKDDELFVPVIKQADEKSIKGIARDITDLANRARTGQLTSEDMQGGTFTVNNTGAFGSVQSMGIINPPQAAILQVESIVKRPVMIGDMFAARDMVNLCLSLDHRVLDGLIVGQFLARVKEIVQNISSETTSLY
ncbi:dihydrolipoamide acetyltransferase family protein [Barrientosiimonas marina]|uniref:Dihydrolipoamide acetyltransferase component of pyruvate dehydrogenase complex n=1 Tax=Lentibacillus kimchii TaxID=1542911 RepID=A0ABW2UZP0_9BACI